MKKFFGLFTVGLLCAFSNFHLYASDFDPKYIFSDGAILPEVTTNVAAFHKNGYKGQGYKVAILDSGFFPEFATPTLQKRIDSSALPKCPYDSPESLNNAFNESCKHGLNVMELFHRIAPEADVVLFDVTVPTKKEPKESDSWYDSRFYFRLVNYISQAIECNVDAISLSIDIPNNDRNYRHLIRACQEAQHAGIPIIMAAGNDSSDEYPAFIDERKRRPLTRYWNVWDADPQIEVWKGLGGKGLYFGGALDHTPEGNEMVWYKCQHPTLETQKHIIFTAGAKIRSPHGNLLNGSSSSAPILAASYILLQQYIDDSGCMLPLGRIWEIMYQTGRDVPYNFEKSTRKNREIPDKVAYKSLDLLAARKYIDDRV